MIDGRTWVNTQTVETLKRACSNHHDKTAGNTFNRSCELSLVGRVVEVDDVFVIPPLQKERRSCALKTKRKFVVNLCCVRLLALRIFGGFRPESFDAENLVQTISVRLNNSGNVLRVLFATLNFQCIDTCIDEQFE